MSILNDIYNERYQVECPPTLDFQALRQETSEIWKQIESVAGFELVDKLQSMEAELWDMREERAFRSGFRLGAGLMAELL